MPGRRARLTTIAAALGAALVLAAAPSSHAARGAPVRLPAAGELLVSRAAVRAAPDPRSHVVRRMRQFRSDLQFRVILALRARRGTDGRWWYQLSLPGRPNGGRGWVRGDLVDLHPVPNRIVVHVRARRLDVVRIAGGRVLLRAGVAVGKPGAPTPLGRDFYVQARFVPVDPFYGVFALETSAYSALTEWPGGGVAGIHGTNRPDLLGKAVSHGCVRVSNTVARRLEALAPLGTPIDLVA